MFNKVIGLLGKWCHIANGTCFTLSHIANICIQATAGYAYISLHSHEFSAVFSVWHIQVLFFALADGSEVIQGLRKADMLE